MKVRIENVKIKDLLDLLIKLSHEHDAVDLIVDPDERKVIVDPVIKAGFIALDTELTDDNIKDLI